MYSTEQLSQIIEQECQNLPLENQPQGLFAPIKYIMEDGGKRMRPLLTLLAANIFSDNINAALSPAISVEVFHNFTLLHDDIMDKAPLRRGRETVHVRWNENAAILSGDAMLILAYQILCRDSTNKELMREFNKVSMEVCQGQQWDMEFERREQVAVEEYLNMIRLKTAVLMASALKMGALAVDAAPEECEELYEFGINLGLAFQIQDDLLDTYGNYETFGKTIGGDIAAGKQTFLKISALQMADQGQKRLLQTSRDHATVRTIYDRLEVEQTAQAAVEKYFARAMTHLNTIESERINPLRSYALQLLRREK